MKALGGKRFIHKIKGSYPTFLHNDLPILGIDFSLATQRKADLNLFFFPAMRSVEINAISNFCVGGKLKLYF